MLRWLPSFLYHCDLSEWRYSLATFALRSHHVQENLAPPLSHYERTSPLRKTNRRGGFLLLARDWFAWNFSSLGECTTASSLKTLQSFLCDVDLYHFHCLRDLG